MRFILALLFCFPSMGATAVYVRSGAGGSGASWSDALSALPSPLVRDRLYYVADGTYSGFTSTTADNGTQTIEVRKATEADHGTSTGWSSTYGDGQALFTGSVVIRANYFTFNGAARTGWRSGYGFKVDAEDPLEIGNAFSSSNHDVTIKYVEAEGSGDTTDAINDRGLRIAYQSDNINVQYCWIHDLGESGIHVASAATDILIEYCVVERNDNSALQHAGGLIATGVSRMTVRYCIWSDIEGTAFIETPTGGHPGCAGGPTADWYIYGNIFVRPSSPQRSEYPNFLIYWFDTQHNGDAVVVNNSFGNLQNCTIGPETDPSSEACMAALVARNNLWFQTTSVAAVITGNVTSATVTHNAFFGDSTTGTSAYSGSGDPFTDWANEDFSLTEAKATAMDAGVTLASTYEVDMFGTTRGADGKWDRGAIEFDAGGGGGTTGGGSGDTAISGRVAFSGAVTIQ